MKTPPADTEVSALSAADETELCVQCFSHNVPGTHFCRKCGAPLSAHSTVGPFEHLFAEGFVYRKAAANPRRGIVVLGMLAIFGGTALTLLLLSANRPPAAGWTWPVASLAMALLCALIAGRTLVNFLRARRTGRASPNP